MSYTPIKSISFDKLINDNSLRIFPNPVTYHLSIEGSYPDDVRIQIFNILGRDMNGFSLKNESSTLSLDVSNLSTGIYLLCINHENIRFIKNE